MEVGMVENVVTKLTSVWLETFQKFAQVRSLESVQMRPIVLITFPSRDNVGKSVQASSENQVSCCFIFKHAVIEVGWIKLLNNSGIKLL